MRSQAWGPIGSLFQIHGDMGKVFDDFFTDRRPTTNSREEDWDWVPPVDILEANDHVEIRAELPGVSKKDVHISVMSDTLTIRGEKRRTDEAEKDGYFRTERHYGRFHRSFTLPANLQMDKVKARFRDGVLMVSIPKAEQAKLKTVEISVE